MSADVSPVAAFAAHLEQARRANDPAAPYATLVTVDEQGAPAARTVTVRGVAADEVSIFVNARSPKVEHLRADGRYELLAFFPTLMVQYRLRGGFELRTGDPDLAREWRQKPRSNQLMDVYQAVGRPQSSEVADHELLRAEVQALADRLAGQPLDVPPTASRLVLLPTFVEQWLGSPADRLHRRTVFRRVDDAWTCTALVP